MFLDFLPRNPATAAHKPLLHWLVRRVEVIRGRMPVRMECAPAFDYARATHETSIISDETIPVAEDGPTPHKKAIFKSKDLTLDLRFVTESTIDSVPCPVSELQELDLSERGHKGLAVYMDLDLEEGQAVTFVLRTPPEESTVRADAIRPTEQKAKELGVSFDRKLLKYSFSMSATLTTPRSPSWSLQPPRCE